MYKFHNNKLPLSFSRLFVRIAEIHKVNTRRNTTELNHYIPRYKTKRLERSIKYVGVKIWSKIPDSIKMNTHNEFIEQLKSDLQNN